MSDHLHAVPESPVALVLTEDQSAFVRESGSHFAVVTVGSYPASSGRMVLHLIECPKEQAADACAVALGTKRALPLKSK